MRDRIQSFRWISIGLWVCSVVNGIAHHYEAAALNVIGALLAFMIMQEEEKKC